MIHFRSLAVGLLALAMHQAHAQGSVTMTAGFAEICQGVLYDSGNAGGGGYDNNEDLTVTLCPDQPGAVMSIHFIVFDLDQSGASGTWDNLSIYDGEDTDGTFLGSYTGSELQGLVVNATLFNPTGCLTLRFISNAIGTGNFTASIACYVPCVPPTAAASMSLPSPARICPGGSVQFDGSASTPGPGQVLTSYAWHLGPTTVVTSTEPTLDHVFDAPGSYPIGLVATDANGCASTNSVDLVVQVSTAPEFTLTTSDTVACVGGMIALDAGVQSVPWAANTVEYGDGIALPDDVGVPFVSQLLVTGLEPGASVGSVDDIAAVCVDMEHSFMGDLVLQVICPNGSEVTLHQQGGGGTYVGGAYDGDTSAEPTPGECWHYCWSPAATNGTWAENAVIPNSTQPGGTPPGTALNPGTYESVGNWSPLVGCPLNGLWQFRAIDLWAADNGFLCAWQLDFDPDIAGGMAGFAPIYGSGCDSTYWTGADLTPTDAWCNTAMVSPTMAGEQPFTFTAINDFGCTFDSTIMVTVLEAAHPYCISLGVEDPAPGALRAYPVPARDLLRVEHDGPLTGHALFDAQGRSLRSGGPSSAPGPLEVDLRGLPAGLYLLRVGTASGTTTLQVTKE